MAALLLLATSVFAAPETKTLRYATERTYLVQAASAPERGLVLLHGAVYADRIVEGATSYWMPLLEPLVHERRLVVAYPLGLAGRCPWDRSLACWPLAQPWDDAPFLEDVVRELSASTGVKDWTAVGISNGAYYLSSAILSGQTLPFARVFHVIGGKGWYREPDVRWAPALTILAGSRDEQNVKEARELEAALRQAAYAERAALSLEEFDGGHEVPEARLLERLDAAFKETRK